MIWDLDGTIEIIHTGSPVNSLIIDREQRIIAGGMMGIIAIDISPRLTASSY